MQVLVSTPPRTPASRQPLDSPEVRRRLAALHEREVNFSLESPPTRSGDGWQVDAYRQPLPPEPPGDPVPGGTWEVAQRLIHDYAFADPRMIRAVYAPDAPLDQRDMLLEGRFYGLRFHLGVRVGGIVDAERRVDGRPVRVWGWDYRTLQGHFEAGQMDWEVWKWLDDGAVEFRIRRFVRTGQIPNPVIRLGWALFGRWMQVRFARRACRRMLALVLDEVAGSTVFPFRFTPVFRAAALPFGITPARAYVALVGDDLVARFGPWRVRTPLTNVRDWQRTGPFSVPKVIGPAHLSLADRGLTFASNAEAALCLRFHEPVGGIDPLRRLRHPGLTVTVADVDGLAASLSRRRDG